MVKAVGPAANGNNRRGLNALGHSHAGELLPPALQIFDEILVGREVFFYDALFTAQLFL